MKLLIATKNPGKFEEIKAGLKALDLANEAAASAGFFLSLEDLGVTEDFEEVGDSFEDIAVKKARFFHDLTGLPTVADDSGIFVEALAGEMGVKTRRWGAGQDASDEDWLAYFMQRMQKEENRRAHFSCAAAYVNGEEEIVCVGESPGKITTLLEAPIKAGIPLSSVFKPEGADSVYSLLSAEEKNRLSHRGKAFQLLLEELKKIYE